MPIRLHKFGEAWGLPDGSPFCLKLEGFLREAGIAYEVAPFEFRRSFRKAPKGKLPFIEDEDGTVVGDSTLIIARLSARHGIDLDGGLDPRQRAGAHAFRRMLDEHLYWVTVYSRWMEDAGWKIVQKTFFTSVPALLRPVATTLVHRQVAAALHAQGLGRHSREEIYAAGVRDVMALSALLGDDAFFFGGDRPALLDLWAYAFIAQIIVPPIASPLREATRTLANLVAHRERLQARLFGPD